MTFEELAFSLAAYVSEKAVGLVEDGVIEKTVDFLKKEYEEREIGKRFKAFCMDSRWRDMFENQGVHGGIDLSGLTSEMQKKIVDQAFEYYHSIDTRISNNEFEKHIKEFNGIAMAESAGQKKQVQGFVLAAYHMVFAFYCEKLGDESLLAINTSMRYIDQKIQTLRLEIAKLTKQNTAALDLQESYSAPAFGFTGRVTELEDIARSFGSKNQTVVLCGQGGMGKSEIARKYAEIHQNDYDLICFAYYQGSIKQTIVSGLFWNHGFLAEKPFDEQFQMKISCLNSLKKRVLLIFDDVNELTDRENLFRISNRNFHILITTRNTQLLDTSPIHIGELDYEKELKPLFQYHSKSSDEWMAQNEALLREILVTILQSHTMLTVLTAKLLNATDNSLADIKKALGQNRLAPEITEKIKSFKDAGRSLPSGNTIDDSLYEHVLRLYSISSLSEDEGKVGLLRNMSLIPYSGILRAKLKEWLQLENLNDINMLVETGWLTMLNEPDGKRISMHSIISDAVFMQTQPTVENCKGLLSAIHTESEPEANEHRITKAYMLEYGEFALNRISSEDLLIAAIAHSIGSLFNAVANYSKALEWHQKASDIRKKVLGKEHPNTAATYNNIAVVYKSQGAYPKALEWYGKALNIREKVLGTEHPDTATTYNNIAMAHHSQGDYPKALEWYQKALGIREKVLGTEHPYTAATYNNIAGVYKNQGNYPKALEWYGKALAIFEKELGKEHPYTATTYNNIAGVYDSQGDYPKALDWYGKALRVYSNQELKEHPNRTIILKNARGAFIDNGGREDEFDSWLITTLENRNPYAYNGSLR